MGMDCMGGLSRVGQEDLAINLGWHRLQLRILVRAMHMLQPGGRLVYSTCSMNPVENEAVVAGALGKFPGPYVHRLLVHHS
jgi:16S rRNA C967 or C1407 C5-methylase (RsmB/RsmF family)